MHAVSVSFAPQKAVGGFPPHGAGWPVLLGRAAGAQLRSCPSDRERRARGARRRVCAWKIAAGQRGIDVPLCKVLSDAFKAQVGERGEGQEGKLRDWHLGEREQGFGNLLFASY